jgi:hypothetical protein
LYSNAFIPLQTKSNNVFRFSGLGAVTNIFEYLTKKISSLTRLEKSAEINFPSNELYPAAMAPAIERPRAADFPRPRAAIKATVLLRDLSKIESKKLITALPCMWLNLRIWLMGTETQRQILTA